MPLAHADARALESLRPPGSAPSRCHRPGAHWHKGEPPFYHDGTDYGVRRGDNWVWLKKSGSSDWWAWTSEQDPPWLWHQGRWWWRSQGVWFMLHEGEVWGYRLFGERQAEGLIHPGTGTRLEYSADGQRVAMTTPGDGAWLFDAQSGVVLQRWSEAQMPKRPKPHAPKSLTLPP